MAGSLAYGRLARRRSPEDLLVASGVLATAGSAGLLLVQATTGGGMVLTSLCLLVSITAFGIFFPAVITIAQSRGRTAPGATSALLGGGQFLFGAAVSPLVGVFGTHSPAPMAAVMTGCLVLATCAAFGTRSQGWTKIARRADLPHDRTVRRTRADLHRYLQEARDALLWKLEGLSSTTSAAR